MPKLTRERLEEYLAGRLGTRVELLGLGPIGGDSAGVSGKAFGYGAPLEVRYRAGGEEQRVVLETVRPGPFGHERLADRAYNALPWHVRALDVGGLTRGGRLVSIADVEETFLLVERAQGRPYSEDLWRLEADSEPGELDRDRCDALCDYLVAIHRVVGGEPGLYVRRIRELMGHSQCIMGLIDSYAQDAAFVTAHELERIEHACLRWRWRLKAQTSRLRQVHGDFHPLNILFREAADFSVLDRSRGEWGEPADDVAALTINYLFLSLQRCGRLAGPFEALFRRFWDRYHGGSGDERLGTVIAPFYVFRALVVASPLWYPGVSDAVRRRLFWFMEAVLAEDRFDPARVNAYCGV